MEWFRNSVKCGIREEEGGRLGAVVKWGCAGWKRRTGKSDGDGCSTLRNDELDPPLRSRLTERRRRRVRQAARLPPSPRSSHYRHITVVTYKGV